MTRGRIAALVLLGALVLETPALASDEEREVPDAAGQAEAAAPSGSPPAAAMQGEPASPEAQGAPPAQGKVARATFTHAVVDREPTDSIDSLANDQTQISFFSEVLGLEGQVVSHRWEYGGEWAAEVLFEVGGPRWRVHSTKRLDPIETGTWTVSVVDASGRVLEKASFTYRQAGSPGAAEVAPEPTPAAPAAP
jgi:hypothetical protein